eukprot:4335976-Pleurochrysis_carterae.AAC.1
MREGMPVCVRRRQTRLWLRTNGFCLGTWRAESSGRVVRPKAASMRPKATSMRPKAESMRPKAESM